MYYSSKISTLRLIGDRHGENLNLAPTAPTGGVHPFGAGPWVPTFEPRLWHTFPLPLAVAQCLGKLESFLNADPYPANALIGGDNSPMIF
jgi:hypothetical protein